MTNLLLSEYEARIIIKERFPSAIITEQESGDLVISYKGWNNALIVAYMWSTGYELTHHYSEIQEIHNSLHENELIRVEVGYYTPSGDGHNWCPFIDFDGDFQSPMGIEVREVEDNDRCVTIYRLLTEAEFKIFQEMEKEYDFLTRV